MIVLYAPEFGTEDSGNAVTNVPETDHMFLQFMSRNSYNFLFLYTPHVEIILFIIAFKLRPDFDLVMKLVFSWI